MEFDVLAIGELLADLISETYVQDLSDAKQFHVFQGGSPANVCANLNYLGLKTALVACVGQDSVGDMLIQSLEGIGVHTQYIQRIYSKPTSIILVGKSKETPSFLAYRMADNEITIPTTTLIRSASVVHTTAFALSKNPAQQSILQTLIQAKNLSKKISCDWNFAPEIWNGDSGMEVFETLCSFNPYLKISIEDFRRFTGRSNASVEDAKTFLERYPTQLCCLTIGADGLWYREVHKDWIFSEAVPVQHVMDTTGAGDAFWAGVLQGICKEMDVRTAIYLGCEFAAQKVAVLGPIYAQVH